MQAYKNNPPNQSITEIQESKQSSTSSPLKIFPVDVSEEAYYTYTTAFISGRFSKNFKSTPIANGSAQLRFGVRNRINTLVLTPFENGKISIVKKYDSRRVELTDIKNELTLVDINKDKTWVVYINHNKKKRGDKNRANLVSIRLKYSALTNAVFIQIYSHSIIGTDITDNSILSVNLEECGGHMDRGLKGYYSEKVRDDLILKVKPFAPRNNAQSIGDIIDSISYIDTQNKLISLFNRSDINESLMIKLLEYDFIDPVLFKDFYLLSDKNNWELLLKRIRKDDRSKSTLSFDNITDVHINSPHKALFASPDEVAYQYCNSQIRLGRELSKKTSTPLPILIHMFKHHQEDREIISNLAENSSTPSWIIEKIMLNDYIHKYDDLQIGLRLSCNKKLKKSFRKRLKYWSASSICKSADEPAWEIKSNLTSPLRCSKYILQRRDSLLPQIFTHYGVIRLAPYPRKFSKEKLQNKSPKGFYIIDKDTDKIPAVEGVMFGVQFELLGSEFEKYHGKQVKLKLVKTYPIKGGGYNKQAEDFDALIGFNYTIAEQFDPSKMMTGEWTYELSYRGKTLSKTTFNIQ